MKSVFFQNTACFLILFIYLLSLCLKVTSIVLYKFHFERITLSNGSVRINAPYVTFVKAKLQPTGHVCITHSITSVIATHLQD